MKMIHFLLLATSLLFTAGCATHGHKSAMMGCGKCECKMMKPSATDPDKCAMCGHTAAEHNKPADDAKDHSEHQH